MSADEWFRSMIETMKTPVLRQDEGDLFRMLFVRPADSHGECSSIHGEEKQRLVFEVTALHMRVASVDRVCEVLLCMFSVDVRVRPVSVSSNRRGKQLVLMHAVD